MSASRTRSAWLERCGGPLLALASLTSGLALSEAAFTGLLRRPGLLRHLPANFARHVRAYYLRHDRDLVQTDAGCVRYDPQLYYTLKPGRFRFRNREFDVEMQVNSLGVRDSEQALHAPELVVLGDSFAMGWGVEQEQTFAARLQALTELRVLNTGISSYGTARELELLRRVDTRRLRFLVVQYDPNDAWENWSLQHHAGVLPIHPRERFEHTLARQQQRRGYWFGKHTLLVVGAALGLVREPAPPSEPSAEEQARTFLAALRTHAIDRRDWQVLVFELRPGGPSDEAFARTLQVQAAAGGWTQVHALQLGAALRPEHYFALDDHLRPEGHAQVARMLAQALARLQARAAR